jgi:deoxyribodipyrimidine photolyase-related protein
MNNFIIFPHQLFYNLDHLDGYKNIYLVEEPRYFTDFKFHKLKLAFHRASMKKYFDYLKKKFNVKYIEFDNLNYKDFKSITIIDPADNKLEKQLQKIFGSKLTILENKNFLIKRDEIDKIFTNKKYSHDEFYKYQRRKLDILMKDDKPEGGKWSYDTNNRLPLPVKEIVPEITKSKLDKYKTEAIKYVENKFPDNYGSLDNFIYPIDTKSTKLWLNKFLKERLIKFGKYEDAVSESYPFVYHSVLSPMMNIGLITDKEVVDISYKFYLNNNIDISDFEGFIRQVIGWRNYVYTLYLLEGETMYESNLLNHTNRLPTDKMWLGKTKLKPIDSIIEKIVKYGYAHHIERLMYLGNFLLLCMIDPKDVYDIFMEWTIDSYDWVMVPNIMGMSQYSTNIMMKRPYFSSYNYLIKMSTYKKDGYWELVWHALYYNFIDKHKEMLSRSYAVAQQVKNWTNKTVEEKKVIKKYASKFLKEFLD